MASKAEFQPAPGRRRDTAPARAPGLAVLPWRDCADDIAAWDALATRAAEPNPFFESWYLLPALRAFDPAGDVRILRFEHEGKLAGLMPLVRQKRYYRRPAPNLANWLHANCFLGAPLVSRGAEAPFWQALLCWADRHTGASLFLHLRDLPLQGRLFEALKAALAADERHAVLVHREERALLASDLSPDAYLESAMSGKKRKELRRQFARLSEAGALAVDRRLDDADLAAWIDRFLTLESAGWKGQEGSALACSPLTAGLFRESLSGAAQRGRLERLTLTLDGQPIAMLATFVTPPGAFSYKTAFDESFARFSPGVLLQRENLAMLARDDVAWTDSCAAADHPMIDHIWRERRPIGRVSIAIGGALRRTAFSWLAKAELARNPVGPGL